MLFHNTFLYFYWVTVKKSFENSHEKKIEHFQVIHYQLETKLFENLKH